MLTDQEMKQLFYAITSMSGYNTNEGYLVDSASVLRLLASYSDGWIIETIGPTTRLIKQPVPNAIKE